MIVLTRRHLAGLLLALLAAGPALALDGKTFSDATGRAVQIPAHPQRVFAAGPPAATLLYALKPQAMVGWVRPVKPADMPFLRPDAAKLPVLGRLTGKGDTLNLEVLLSARPDLIVDYGSINATYADLAARVQDQAGVSYVLVDGSFAAMPQAIRQMADALDVPARGETLADYAERTLADLDAMLAGIPETDRPGVYLARGPEGTETAGRASINAEIIARVGARNVVDAAGDGLANVSPEQVQAWAPDVIITVDQDFAANVGQMPEWRGVPAVEQGRVYLAPAAPFGFIDAPPSVNRLAGVIWLSHKLYPQAAKGDLHQQIADFYELFYGPRPSDDTVSTLMGD